MAAYNRYKANTEYATRWLCTENLRIVASNDRSLVHECPNPRNCTTRQIVECAARIASNAPRRITDDILRCLDRVVLDRNQLLAVFRQLPLEQRSDDWEESNQRHLHFNHVVSVARNLLASVYQPLEQPKSASKDSSHLDFSKLALDDQNDDDDGELEVPSAHASIADQTLHQELDDPHVKEVFDFISSLEDVQSLCDEAKALLAKFSRGEVGFYTAVNTLRAVGEYYSTTLDIKDNFVAQAAVRNEEFRVQLLGDFPQLHQLLGEDGHLVAARLNDLALKGESTINIPRHLEQNDFVQRMLDRASLLKEFGDGVIKPAQVFAAVWGGHHGDPGQFYHNDTLSFHTLACAMSDIFSRNGIGPPRYVSFTIEMLMHDGIGSAMAAGALKEAAILRRDIEAACQTLRDHRRSWEEEKEFFPTCPSLDTILKLIGELATMLERKTVQGRPGWSIRYAGGQLFFVPDAVTEVMPMLLGYNLSLLRVEFCKRMTHLLLNRNMQMPYIAHLYRMLRGMRKMKHEWKDLEFIIARQSLLLDPSGKEALPTCAQNLPYKQRVDHFVQRTPINRNQQVAYDPQHMVWFTSDRQPNDTASEHLYFFESPRKYFCAPRKVVDLICKQSLDNLLDKEALQKLSLPSLRTYIAGEQFSRREVFQQVIRNFEDEEPHMRFDYAGFLMFSWKLLSSEVASIAAKEPVRCMLFPGYPNLSKKLDMFMSGVRYWTSSTSRSKAEETYLQAHQLLWTLGAKLDSHFDRDRKTIDNFMLSSQSSSRG